jgi:hypothetical protein
VATNSKTKKRYEEMTSEELAVLTAQFDEEFAINRAAELPTKMANNWKRAKRKRGRPKIGKGAKVISVSLEQQLLKDVDRLAKTLGLTRAKLIAIGLSTVLARFTKRKE